MVTCRAESVRRAELSKPELIFKLPAEASFEPSCVFFHLSADQKRSCAASALPSVLWEEAALLVRLKAPLAQAA